VLHLPLVGRLPATEHDLLGADNRQEATQAQGQTFLDESVEDPVPIPALSE
jgi:hypothetical protein